VTYNVNGSKYNLTLIDPKTKAETAVVVNELASTYLKHTEAWGFATRGPGKATPYSFVSAMADADSYAFAMWKCVLTAKDTECNFPGAGDLALVEALDPVQPFEEEVMAPANHSVCNMATGQCEECDPGSSGSGCVDADSCKKTCKKGPAKNYLYECNWNSSTCAQLANATFTSAECLDRCKKDQFGKCNFTTGRCQECTRGASDPDCIYTMDYCKVIEGLGQCAKKGLSGIYRNLMINPSH